MDRSIFNLPLYYWVCIMVAFHLNHARYVDYYDGKIPLYTKDVLLTVDPPMVDKLLHHQAAKPIQQIYNSNDTKRIALFGGANVHNKYDQVTVYLYEQDAPTMLNNKGLALAELGMYNQSIVYFDKALAINPNDLSALNNKNSTLEALSKIK